VKNLFKQTIGRALKRTLHAITLGSVITASMASVANAAGLMSPLSSNLPALEIRSHDVLVTIEDGYAVTQVDQVFSNPNGQDLEATYHFPVPDKAAVSEFTVWIDDQPVIGEVLEKQQAQSVYQEEKAAGRETGIASKNKHYNFEIKVAPVRAISDTRIRLVYMQAVNIDTGIGRYVYPLEDGETNDQATNFWTANEKVRESFTFNLNLRSGYPVNGLRVPAHPAAVVTQHNNAGSDHEWQVQLRNTIATTGTPVASLSDDIQAINTIGTDDVSQHSGDAQLPSTLSTASSTSHVASLDQDIVVYWRLADNLPGSIDLVTHKEPGAARGTFMLTVTPGDDLAKISEGRDWAFILDKSGSMKGKYSTLIDGVQKALSALKTGDRFQLITFSDQPQKLTGGWVNVTPENIQFWSNKLAATQPGGSTNLYSATETALRVLDADRTSALILVTDGEANVGVTEKKSFLKLMQKRDVRLFTAVMGNGSNRPLLEAMTEVSNGFAVSVSNSDDIVGKLMEFTSKVSHEALHNVSLKISGIKTADLTPKVTTSLYRGEQLSVFGHYWGNDEATVTLSGKVSGAVKKYQSRFPFTDNTSNPEIERLWAYAKITDLQNMQDYLGTNTESNSEHKNAIVDIAVANSLVTDYTSMVVMRDEQFEARGIERKNRDRRTRETQAATQRATQPVASNRVDNRQPAFKQSRPSHSRGSGGGALSLEWLGLLLILIATPAFNRFRGPGKATQ